MTKKVGLDGILPANDSGLTASHRSEQRRVAELLRVVSQATAELATVFEATHGPSQTVPSPKRRRHRSVRLPSAVSDADVAAARRALRRAGS